MTDENTLDSTSLWKALETTDPAATKSFSRPGGFKGTAIEPMWRIKRLTEELGPCGFGWGFEVKDDRIVGERSPIHVIRIRFWYDWNGQRCEFDSYGCTPVLVKRRDGMIPNEDFAKMSLTDAIVTASTKLGQCADVYEGRFDPGAPLSDKYGSAPQPQQAPRRNGAPTVNTAAPPQEGMAHGAGGDEQTCPKCGDQGRTMRFWEPGSRSPDLECATGCTEEYKGRTNPLKWWSVSKGSKKPTAQKAAFDAQAPQGHGTSQDEDIPF